MIGEWYRLGGSNGDLYKVRGVTLPVLLVLNHLSLQRDKRIAPSV